MLCSLEEGSVFLKGKDPPPPNFKGWGSKQFVRQMFPLWAPKVSSLTRCATFDTFPLLKKELDTTQNHSLQRALPKEVSRFAANFTVVLFLAQGVEPTFNRSCRLGILESAHKHNQLQHIYIRKGPEKGVGSLSFWGFLLMRGRPDPLGAFPCVALVCPRVSGIIWLPKKNPFTKTPRNYASAFLLACLRYFLHRVFALRISPQANMCKTYVRVFSP